MLKNNEKKYNEQNLSGLKLTVNNGVTRLEVDNVDLNYLIPEHTRVDTSTLNGKKQNEPEGIMYDYFEDIIVIPTKKDLGAEGKTIYEEEYPVLAILHEVAHAQTAGELATFYREIQIIETAKKVVSTYEAELRQTTDINKERIKKICRTVLVQQETGNNRKKTLNNEETEIIVTQTIDTLINILSSEQNKTQEHKILYRISTDLGKKINLLVLEMRQFSEQQAWKRTLELIELIKQQHPHIIIWNKTDQELNEYIDEKIRAYK